MDSLTQITLGAAVGEAVLGKKVGNRAVLWGALAGTLPDLDVVFSLFMDPVDYLSVHRGFSHSVFFPFVAAPLLAYIAHSIHKRSTEASYFGWIKLFFWAIITHPMLDMMTGYGTQLFYPITRYTYEFNTIFIVDPLYTLPFLFCLIVAMTKNRNSPKRRFWNWLGISLSTFYLLLTIPLKLFAIPVFQQALDDQQIEYERMRTFPNPLTSFYWRALVETDDGYYEGHYSYFQKDRDVTFHFIPGNHHLLEDVKDDYAVGELLWFSKGYYSVEQRDDHLLFNDLRFGSYLGFKGIHDDFTFSFKIYTADHPDFDETTFRQTPMGFDFEDGVFGEYLRYVFNRRD